MNLNLVNHIYVYTVYNLFLRIYLNLNSIYFIPNLIKFKKSYIFYLNFKKISFFGKKISLQQITHNYYEVFVTLLLLFNIFLLCF